MSAVDGEAREALARVLDRHVTDAAFESGCRLSCGYDGDDLTAHIADAILAAGWQSPEQVEDAIAAAEQCGREDNADHGMCYVFGSEALAAKLATAWIEGAKCRAHADPATTVQHLNPYRSETP